MSLAKKTIIIFSVLGVCLCVGGYAVQRLTVTPAFEAYEKQAALGTIARVRDALDTELRALDVLNTEYSYWDDAYAFAQGNAPSFQANYLRDAYLQDSNIDLFLIFNTDGEEMFRYVDGSVGEQAEPLENVVLEALAPGHPILGPREDEAFVYGYLRTQRGLMQLVSYPIVKTSGEGTPAGSLTTGRYLTPERVAELTDLVAARITLFDQKSQALPQPVQDAQFALAFQPAGEHVSLGNDRASGYFLVTDVFGKTAGIFEVTSPDSIAPVARTAINWATVQLSAASLFFIFAAWLFARQFVITPINTLIAGVARIRETGDLDIDIPAQRRDEIGVLAANFGALTAELRAVQQNLEQARDAAIGASKMKSEFLARMSHEIRTPMNGVLGMTEVLRSTPLSDKQQRLAATIYESGSSLLHIINDVLDFSKIESGKLEVELLAVDLRELLQNTVTAFAEEADGKNLTLDTHIELEPQCTLYLDPVKIRQVLTNLIANAIKFTKAGGVSVRASYNSPSADSLIARFEVSDTGIGIEAEKQSAIFDAFSQVDETTTRFYGGTGLGLSISKQLVELMGGDLRVHSTPGEGSTFSFELTLQRGAELSATA